MSTILAIDTSTTLASVALLHDGFVSSRESSGVQTHSQMILPMLQQLLADTGISLAQCDAIAVGVGPGSFTGVRTACGIAQGLAFGADLPVVNVVTLVAMAEACRKQSGANDVLALLDAQMGEVYWAQYRHVADRWQEILLPTLSAPVDVITQGTVTACGNGLSSYASAFVGKGYSECSESRILPHAKEIACLGQILLAEGKAVAAHQVQPLYLRNKVAQTTAERAAKAVKASTV